MRALILLCAGLAVAGCEESHKVSNKRASEIIEEVNRGPSFMIEPEPILEHEIERLRFRSAGCVFSPGTGGHGAMLLAMQEAGYMKVDGELIRFAADSGSAMLPQGVRSRYFGTSHWFKLTFTDKSGGAHLIVGDHADNIVFEADGKAWCDKEPETASPAPAPE